MAPALRVEVNPVNLRDAGEIERAVAAFARTTNGGLILNSQRGRNTAPRFGRYAGGRPQAPRSVLGRLFAAAGGLVPCVSIDYRAGPVNTTFA